MSTRDQALRVEAMSEDELDKIHRDLEPEKGKMWTRDQALRLKALKPPRYDMSEEEWDKIHHNLEAEKGKRKLCTFVQLLAPLETLSQIQSIAGLAETPSKFDVQTYPENPQKHSQLISVCQLEHKDFWKVHDKMTLDGYKEYSMTIDFQGQKRRAHWFKEIKDTSVNC